MAVRDCILPPVRALVGANGSTLNKSSELYKITVHIHPRLILIKKKKNLSNKDHTSIDDDDIANGAVGRTTPIRTGAISASAVSTSSSIDIFINV